MLHVDEQLFFKTLWNVVQKAANAVTFVKSPVIGIHALLPQSNLTFATVVCCYQAL